MSYLSASYKKCNDEFRCDLAKHAISHRARPTAKKYGVSESTVRGFVKSLKRQQANNPDVDFIALPQKKRGRLKLLPEEVDEKVINIIKSMRESGAVINYNIMTASQRGLLQPMIGHVLKKMEEQLNSETNGLNQ